MEEEDTREPIDPFMETPSPESKSGGFHLKAPGEPLTKEKLMNFLSELQGLVTHIGEMSRDHQHLLAAELQQVKNLLHSSDLPKEVTEDFEKLTNHFNALLTHSAPIDREAALKDIQQVVQHLE